MHHACRHTVSKRPKVVCAPPQGIPDDHWQFVYADPGSETVLVPELILKALHSRCSTLKEESKNSVQSIIVDPKIQ